MNQNGLPEWTFIIALSTYKVVTVVQPISVNERTYFYLGTHYTEKCMHITIFIYSIHSTYRFEKPKNTLIESSNRSLLKFPF